jgi:predicted double-glycine peptidase
MTEVVMRCVLLALSMLAATESVPAQVAQLPSLGAGAFHVPVVSMREARRSTTLLQQFDFSCGSAALATLLTHHYGHPINEQAVFERMYAQGDRAKIQREGFSMLDMKQLLASLGYEADGFEQPLDQLTDAGLPAIVLVNEKGYAHFVVIKGVQADRVLLGDPAQGTRAIARAAFDAIWQNRILFVVHNRTNAARFNRLEDWRVATRAPLHDRLAREAAVGITLPRRSPGDF